jgi:prevent-host-death family protein
MVQATAMEFQRKLGEFQHKAQREPVVITRRGRREFVLMSAEHYDWLTAAAQRSHLTEDAVPAVVAAVENAEMDPALAHLDELLK